MHTPTLENLQCLIMWPEGTVGYNEENRVVATLLSLCISHGFGRVSQLATQIEDIWRHPEAVEKYKKMQAEHASFLKECRGEK